MFKWKKAANFIPIQKPIEGLPDMDWGAPSPDIRADEHTLSIAYYLNELPDSWDGSTVHLRNPDADISEMAIFTMRGLRAFSQTTNDQHHGCAYLDYKNGHLGSHDVWEIVGSKTSFPLFRDETRESFKHLIFAFHDTSVEVFCKSFEFEITTASSSKALNR